MDSFWIILIGIVVIGLLVGLGKGQKAEEAKKVYGASLTALKLDPTNAELRQVTLELGRKYSNLTRNGKGVALFDEVALMNDLNLRQEEQWRLLSDCCGTFSCKQQRWVQGR